MQQLCCVMKTRDCVCHVVPAGSVCSVGTNLASFLFVPFILYYSWSLCFYLLMMLQWWFIMALFTDTQSPYCVFGLGLVYVGMTTATRVAVLQTLAATPKLLHQLLMQRNWRAETDLVFPIFVRVGWGGVGGMLEIDIDPYRNTFCSRYVPTLI